MSSMAVDRVSYQTGHHQPTAVFSLKYGCDFVPLLLLLTRSVKSQDIHRGKARRDTSVRSTHQDMAHAKVSKQTGISKCTVDATFKQ